MHAAIIWKRLGTVLAAAMFVSTLAMAVDKPFNGKDLEGWKAKGKDMGGWTVGTAKLDPDNPKKLIVSKEGDELINAKAGGVDLYSTFRHGDAIIKIEVMVPKGSNSGIYVQGAYEIQVLDSYGRDKNPGPGDMGGIYGAAAPKNPKYKKPGEWQSFEIHFQAPKFDADGKKTANAKFLKVLLNGDVIHENIEVKGVTGGSFDGKETAMGPILFQGNHGAVAYRNLTVEPLTAEK